MLKISIWCTRFKTDYNSFTSKSSENICSNCGGVFKKNEKQGETQFTTKTEVPPPLNANLFYFFESQPIYDQTQGSSVVSPTL
jgi:hypothetical protein